MIKSIKLKSREKDPENFYCWRVWLKYKKIESKYDLEEGNGYIERWKNVKNQNAFESIKKAMIEIEGGEETWQSKRKELLKAMNRRKQAMKRVKKYIGRMFKSYYEDQLKFLTFDIGNKYLQRDTRRKVKSWLENNCMDYIANPDHGEQKGRLHYHAVVATKTNIFNWDYGHIHVEQISVRKGTQALAKYTNKFANHATKNTALRAWHPRGMKEIEVIPW